MVVDEVQIQAHAKVNGTTHVDDRMDVDRRTPEQEERVVSHQDHRTAHDSSTPAPAQRSTPPHRVQIDSTLPVPGIWQAKTASSHACVNQCSVHVYERDAVKWNVARRRSTIKGPEDNGVGDAPRRSGTTSRVEDDVSMMDIDVSRLESDASRAGENPSVIVDTLVHMQSQWPEKGHLVIKLNEQSWLPVDLLRGIEKKIFVALQILNLGKRTSPEEGLDEPANKTRRLPTSGATQPPPGPEVHLAFPDPSKLAGRSPAFQQPSPLVSFSYTPARVLEFTNSALKYYIPPPRSGLRLDYGYERWVRRPEERGRLDGLLKAYARVLERGAAGQIGIVSWRGVMTKILTAPYEDRDGWDLNVMLVDGTMYLEEHLSDAKLKEKNDMEPRHRKMSYYGYAFESYCTSETPQRAAGRPPHVAPDAPFPWGGDVNTNVQWCSVVKTKLGDTRMVIGGEVDCVEGHYSDSRTNNFVELKTSMAIRGASDQAKFEKKLLKFYFQSFLLGVPKIVVGFRTPAGVIREIQDFKTMEIPRMVRGKPGAWDPTVCLAWGERFFGWLRGNVGDASGDQPDATNGHQAAAVWRVRFTPKAGVSVSRLDVAGVTDVEGGEDRVGFLPRWYWEDVLKKSPTNSGQTRRVTPSE
ncbi:RAI1-domain-containing protein [Schizophyllum commune H4-8]|uniref:Decapping nuclease n=1 Tax=Schizophyllum commune (strain H4-8 / FGSC 9210) TaxID=578458 RepID=D8Q3T4_SCHCM|nr:RAI1-domain-containing protein [Schizophyllum commune H4-8]KAI5892903.1 RAI1-domain-containing protein [Schizophyllum commune H4-8]